MILAKKATASGNTYNLALMVYITRGARWGRVLSEAEVANTTAIPLLLGRGLDEFSMSATSILPARSQIAKLSTSEMKEMAEQALQHVVRNSFYCTFKKLTIILKGLR